MAEINRSQSSPIQGVPQALPQKPTSAFLGSLQPSKKLPVQLPQTPPGGPRVSPGAVSPIPESELSKKGIMGLKSLPETPPVVKPSAEQLRQPLPLTPPENEAVREVLDFADDYMEATSFVDRRVLALKLPHIVELLSDYPEIKSVILQSLKETASEIEKEPVKLESSDDRTIALETIHFLINEIKGA